MPSRHTLRLSDQYFPVHSWFVGGHPRYERYCSHSSLPFRSTYQRTVERPRQRAARRQDGACVVGKHPKPRRGRICVVRESQGQSAVVMTGSIQTGGISTRLSHQRFGDGKHASGHAGRSCLAWLPKSLPVTRSESSRGQTLGTIRTPTLREVSRGKVQR